MPQKSQLNAVVAAVLWISAAAAQTPPAVEDPADAACLECHAGSSGPKRGGTEIDPAAYAKSTHAKMAGCAGCHAKGFEDYPHKATRADAAACSDCHTGDDSPPYNRARIEEDVNQSVHITLLSRLSGDFRGDGTPPVFPCRNCHDPHVFRPVREMESIAEAVRLGNAVCMECHGQADERGGITAGETRANLTARHAFIPAWDLHTKAARCVDCHTPGNEDTIHKILPAAKAQRDCVQCHSRDSLLLRKLYSHIAAEQRSEGGLLNSVIYNDAYLIGATKFEWLDRLSLGLFGITLVGIAVHAMGRWIGSRRRRP